MMHDGQWMQSVGFSHLLEDGLTIVQGQSMDEKRRSYVLQDLSELLSQVVHGADLVRRNTFFVNSVDCAASESYSLFERHLNPRLKSGWDDLIRAAASAFLEYRSDPSKVTTAQKDAAEKVLSEILASVSGQPNHGLIPTQDDFRIGA